MVKGITESIDTVVVPAREVTFNSVFLGERRWYGIGIRKDVLPLLKYIAIYQSAPTSAITHWAHIDSITDSQSEKRFIIIIKGEPQAIGPIPNKERYNGKIGLIIGPRYTSLEKLKNAKHFVEACP